MTCNNSKQYQKSDIGSTYYVQILKGTNEGCPVIFWQSHHFWHWLSLSNQLLNDNIIGQTPVRLFSLFFPFRLKLIFKGRIEKTCVQIKKNTAMICKRIAWTMSEMVKYRAALWSFYKCTALVFHHL